MNFYPIDLTIQIYCCTEYGSAVRSHTKSKFPVKCWMAQCDTRGANWTARLLAGAVELLLLLLTLCTIAQIAYFVYFLLNHKQTKCPTSCNPRDLAPCLVGNNQIVGLLGVQRPPTPLPPLPRPPARPPASPERKRTTAINIPGDVGLSSVGKAEFL